MAYWLFKSEPSTWSWAMQKAKGNQGEEWSGVRNYAARNFMRTMQIGDQGFFYHSNQGKEIVGIVEVCKTAHQDSTTEEEQWQCVDVRAVCDMPVPVSLKSLKAQPSLQNMALVKQARLSVQPVTEEEWDIICKLGHLPHKI